MEVLHDLKVSEPRLLAETLAEGVPDHEPRVQWHDFHFRSQDGLRLYARDYAQTEGPLGIPLLCLAGLSRNCQDFHKFARKHSPRRRIITMDYRGRGRSEYAADWSTYNPVQEMQDALALLTVLGVHEVIVLGTSRGGLIAMLMAALRPTAVHGVILNDVGPEVEPRGLLRIKGFMNQGGDPLSWTDAVFILRHSNRGFEGLSDEDWLAWARRNYRSVNGMPVSDFDPNLNKMFATHDDLIEGRVPTLWAQYNALKRRPVLVLRGANSDILVPETVDRMREIKPDLMAETVPGRGHAPFLDERVADAAISDFLLRYGYRDDEPD
ncbi:MAG: alpha/beta hydrolase [Pseudomonadota bacterium]